MLQAAALVLLGVGGLARIAQIHSEIDSEIGIIMIWGLIATIGMGAVALSHPKSLGTFVVFSVLAIGWLLFAFIAPAIRDRREQKSNSQIPSGQALTYNTDH